MTTTRAVALRISNLLLEKGMSRYALCKKIAMSEMTLKHIICEDTKTMQLDTIIQIANGLGLTLSEFFDSELFNKDNLDVN